MTTQTHPRAEPCTQCGEAVTVVEMTSDAVGGGRAYRRAPVVAMQHTVRRAGGLSDPADDGCTRAVAPVGPAA